MQGKKESSKVIIDLDALFDFVFAKEDRDVDTNIEETHKLDDDNIPILVSKTVRENKSSDHTQHEAIRYEFMRNLINLFDDVELDHETNRPYIASYSQELALNTLYEYGIIKNI